MTERMGKTRNRVVCCDAAEFAKMKNRLLKRVSREKKCVMMNSVNCSAKVGGCFGEKERRERERIGGDAKVVRGNGRGEIENTDRASELRHAWMGGA